MKWSDYDLSWGRPLRSILAIFDKKHLKFKYAHLETVNFTILEEGCEIKQKKFQDFDEYKKFLKKNDIILDHTERIKFISEKFNQYVKKSLARIYRSIFTFRSK